MVRVARKCWEVSGTVRVAVVCNALATLNVAVNSERRVIRDNACVVCIDVVLAAPDADAWVTRPAPRENYQIRVPDLVLAKVVSASDPDNVAGVCKGHVSGLLKHIAFQRTCHLRRSERSTLSSSVASHHHYPP